MKYLYCFNSHSDFYNKDMVLKDDNVVLCKDTDINKWHAHYHHPPYDAQIEYLECTGIQWIDPDYNSGNSSIISITAQLTSLTAQCRIIGNNSGYLEIYINGSAKWGAASNGTTVSSNITADTNVHIFKIDNVANKAYSDNSSWNITHNGASYYNKVGLFGRLNNNTGCTGRIYSARIYEGTTLIRDLIPVRVGTTGYMYDKISSRFFGNAGTGNFTLGQDIVPIEYLQSSGTQYINLNFGFDKTDEVYTSFAILTTTNDKYINSPITWNNNNNRFGMGYHNGGYCIGYGNVGTTSTLMSPKTANDTKIHVWEYKNYMFKIVDLNLTRNVSSITFGGTTNNLRLFYGYNANTQAKIASYKHIKNGQTVIDLIPVRKGTTGYMYDKVSGQLFGNNGTGAFTLGPDI